MPEEMLKKILKSKTVGTSDGFLFVYVRHARIVAMSHHRGEVFGLLAGRGYLAGVGAVF